VRYFVFIGGDIEIYWIGVESLPAFRHDGSARLDNAVIATQNVNEKKVIAIKKAIPVWEMENLPSLI